MLIHKIFELIKGHKTNCWVFIDKRKDGNLKFWFHLEQILKDLNIEDFKDFGVSWCKKWSELKNSKKILLTDYPKLQASKIHEIKKIISGEWSPDSLFITDIGLFTLFGIAEEQLARRGLWHKFTMVREFSKCIKFKVIPSIIRKINKNNMDSDEGCEMSTDDDEEMSTDDDEELSADDDDNSVDHNNINVQFNLIRQMVNQLQRKCMELKMRELKRVATHLIAENLEKKRPRSN